MKYRMQEPAHNMDTDFMEALEAAGITVVDRSGEPWNVIFEHQDEEVLRQFWRDHWGDEDGQPFILPAADLPCASVVTRHLVRVDFEYGDLDDNQELVDNEIFVLANRAGAEETQIFQGNACCAPYLTCEVADLQVAYALGRSLVDFLLKAGCKVTS